MEPLSFFGSFVQKLRVSCFLDSFVQKTTQQSVGSCSVIRNSQIFYKFIKNNPFFSADTYVKNIVSEENCIARQDDKMCFLPNCRSPEILIGDIKEFLQKSYAFCLNY